MNPRNVLFCVSLVSIIALSCGWRESDGSYYENDDQCEHRFGWCDPNASDLSDAQDQCEPPSEDVGPCDGIGNCTEGFVCQEDGRCHECPEAVCPCRSDEDCTDDEVCDLQTGTCGLLACSDLTEEACLLRSDCIPIYGGQNCTDSNGGECTSGDQDCTCETFSFGSCVDLE